MEPATLPQGPGGDSTAAPVEETLEANPTFSDISMTLYVYVANGNIRSKTETVLTEGAICGYVKEGDTLAATGESKEWYRVLYNEKTCYVRKSIVCDNALIDAFQDVRDEVTISQNVNVRSMPKAIKSSANDLSIRGTLLKGIRATACSASASETAGAASCSPTPTPRTVRKSRRIGNTTSAMNALPKPVPPPPPKHPSPDISDSK